MFGRDLSIAELKRQTADKTKLFFYFLNCFEAKLYSPFDTGHPDAFQLIVGELVERLFGGDEIVEGGDRIHVMHNDVITGLKMVFLYALFTEISVTTVQQDNI